MSTFSTPLFVKSLWRNSAVHATPCLWRNQRASQSRGVRCIPIPCPGCVCVELKGLEGKEASRRVVCLLSFLFRCCLLIKSTTKAPPGKLEAPIAHHSMRAPGLPQREARRKQKRVEERKYSREAKIHKRQEKKRKKEREKEQGREGKNRNRACHDRSAPSTPTNCKPLVPSHPLLALSLPPPPVRILQTLVLFFSLPTLSTHRSLPLSPHPTTFPNLRRALRLLGLQPAAHDGDQNSQLVVAR